MVSSDDDEAVLFELIFEQDYQQLPQALGNSSLLS